jgi:predicted nucleic acid-binding protein
LLVLVSDTSVIIDLERGEILESVFKLNYEFVVPDLLFEEELKPYGGDRLLKLGLQVAELDGAGVGRAIQRRQKTPSLSLPDVFALTLARENGWVLLTGDGSLRALADAESLECHGVLWVFDELEVADLLEAESLHTSLSKIIAHERCRLPKKEVNIRLNRYKNRMR